MSEKLFIFSDAHIGSRKSTFLELGPYLVPYVEQADKIICNGDMLDYKSRGRAMALARNLSTIMQRYPEKQFYFLQGNHDYMEELNPAFDYLHKQNPNFIMIEDSLKLGDAFITHGDLLARGQTLHERQQPVNSWMDWEARSNTLEHYSTQLSDFAAIGDKEEASSIAIPHEESQAMWFSDEQGNRHRLTSAVLEKFTHIITGHSHTGFINQEHAGHNHSNLGSFNWLDSLDEVPAILADYDGERLTNIELATQSHQSIEWGKRLKDNTTQAPETGIRK